MFKLNVDDPSAGQRIDRFLSQQLPQHSRSFLQRMIEQGNVRLNGNIIKPSHPVEEGDLITVEIPPSEQTEIVPENIPLDILYEDESLLVVNKPAGLVVHPGAGVRSGTLVNALLHHCQDLSGVGGRLRPGIVHRLDKDTSGILVVAKDDLAHHYLQKQFAEKTARREYRALVWRQVDAPKGQIDTFLNRSKSDRKKFAVSASGKPALTFYEVEKRYPFLTLLRVWLKTGRSHQIRVHLKHINHPVFGDPDYGGRNKQIKQISHLPHRQIALNLLNLIDRQALHAFQLEFEHPTKKEWMQFSAPLPADFQNVLNELESVFRDTTRGEQ